MTSVACQGVYAGGDPSTRDLEVAGQYYVGVGVQLASEMLWKWRSSPQSPLTSGCYSLLTSHLSLRGYQMPLDLCGRTTTHVSKKGYEKVLGRVLGKGSQKASHHGGLLWVLQ